MANGCSIYETRLRTFYRKMEARYGSSSRCYVTPSRSSRRWRNTASNISAAGQGDVVPDAGRRLLGSSTRLHQSRRRGIHNRSGHSGGSSCVVGRSLSTRTAARLSRDLEKAQNRQSSNATAAAADTVRRNAGSASHRGLEEGGGWLGWARACGSSRKSRARSTSRSSSPSNSSGVPGRALNSLSSRSPRTQQGGMLPSNRTAKDKEVSEEKVCNVSAAGRTAFCTTALRYQHCHPKDEDHLERQDLEVKQTEQRKRQQTLQKMTKRAQLLQQETVSSSMQKDAASKRRRPATKGNANKRARFTDALPAAADDATLSEKNSWAAASTASIFGRRQEHQQNTERLQRRGSCDSQNSGWARCKAVGEILAAVEPIELKAEAVTTNAGYNSAGAAAVAPATYSATVAQSIPAALFAISLRKSTSSRRHRTRSPVATPPFTTEPSLAAPLEPAGTPAGKWSDQERPPSVELAAVTDNREALFLAGKLLYCSSTPEVLGVEAPPSQEGSQQHERSASTGAATAARVRSSADVVGDVPKCKWLLKATRQFDAAAHADDARQQLEAQHWHLAQQVHAKQSWQQCEVEQRHQCNEQRTQHIPEPDAPLDPQQWQQQSVRRLHQEKLPRPQQTLHSLQQPCQKQELCHMQQADHSRQRKAGAPQQLPERSVQAVRVQRLQKFCHQAVNHSQQGEGLQRDAHHRRRQSALLLRHSSGRTGRDCLLQGAAAGATSGEKSRARIHTTRSSKPLSNDSGGSLDYPNPSNNSNSNAAAAVMSGDENEEWCKTTSGCNSSNNRRKRSSPTALISSRCNSDAKSTCASAVATAAAFNALPRARGVWFDAIRSLVRTSWKEGGRVRTAGFPVRTLGLAEARMRAVEYRFFRCPNDPLPSDLRAIVPRKKPEEYGWTT